MILYYGLTNYHMLCCILHKLIYNPKKNAIFVASQGILKSRINSLRKSKIFDEVYYIEDTNVRDSNFNILNTKSTKDEIENVSNKFITEYEKILPFSTDDFDEIYLAADHGVFGIYILMKNKQYVYLEDGRGIYSNWKVLDSLLRIKNPGIQIMSNYYNAYGRSSLIKEKFIAFDSQLDNYDDSKCVNFDVNEMLNKLTEKQVENILSIFEIRYYKMNPKEKSALVLTQRFSTYGMLEQENCILLYSILCDLFARNHRIYLKPHPADKCEYSNVFKEHIILEKEIPSELIRFIIKRNFDVGISTYSSSIHSLKHYINNIYNIDETIVNFKEKIFKLYVLFEIVNYIGGNIKTSDDLLDHCFLKYYNLNKHSQYVFDFSNKKEDSINIVSSNHFNDANCIIKINKNMKNEYLSHKLLCKSEVLYIKIIDKELLRKINNLKFERFLPVSKIYISVNIELL